MPRRISLLDRRQFLQATAASLLGATSIGGPSAAAVLLADADRKSQPPKPEIRRLGTLDFGVNETTPVVFHDRLYRFEYINRKYHRSILPRDYFRFIDVETGKKTSPFALDHHLGSAYVKNDTMYVFGVRGNWGGDVIDVFWSTDLEHWESQPALSRPGWMLYNNSVCRGDDGYVMAFEVGSPPEVVGTQYTSLFARSDDLLEWEFMGLDRAWTRDFYIGCPTIRYLDGYYYIFYLARIPERLHADDDTLPYETHLVRTRDFLKYELSPLNPVLTFSDGDRQIRNPDINAEQQLRISRTPNINVSDMDLCEFNGEVIFYYSWGSQRAIEYLGEARYTGTLRQFLKAFYPD